MSLDNIFFLKKIYRSRGLFFSISISFIWYISSGILCLLSLCLLTFCYMPVRELRSTSFSVIPVTSSSFPSCLCHSRHFSVAAVFLFYVPFIIVFHHLSVFRLFLRYGSIPPLSCSEHHFSDLWLHYHTLTSSHSCGWTISLLSS